MNQSSRSAPCSSSSEIEAVTLPGPPSDDMDESATGRLGLTTTADAPPPPPDDGPSDLGLAHPVAMRGGLRRYRLPPVWPTPLVEGVAREDLEAV